MFQVLKVFVAVVPVFALLCFPTWYSEQKHQDRVAALERENFLLREELDSYRGLVRFLRECSGCSLASLKPEEVESLREAAGTFYEGWDYLRGELFSTTQLQRQKEVAWAMEERQKDFLQAVTFLPAEVISTWRK